MGNIYVRPEGKQRDRAYSDNLWGSSNREAVMIQPALGYCMQEDFVSFGKAASNVYVGKCGLWKSYEDTGATIQMMKKQGGWVELSTDSTDNDEVWLQAGDGNGASFTLSDTAGDNDPCYFEAAFQLDSVADSSFGFFVGLAEEGAAAADFISDAGALASKDFVGFHRDEADGDALDWVYRKAGQALQTKKADIVTGLEADTTIKAGFYFDGTSIIPVVDGTVYKADKITSTDIAAATFPDAEFFMPIFGHKNGSGDARKSRVDWLECLQEDRT